MRPLNKGADRESALSQPASAVAAAICFPLADWCVNTSSAKHVLLQRNGVSTVKEIGGWGGGHVPRARPPRASSEIMTGKGPNCSGAGQMAPRCYRDMRSGTRETRTLSPPHRPTAQVVNE